MFIDTDTTKHMTSETSKPTGFADVTNKGAYIATFGIGYYYNGQFFSFDSPNILYNQSFRIAIPADATDIVFLARLYLTPKETRVICRNAYKKSFRKYFQLNGTIFSPGCSEIG